jgi:hypothetical protein
MKGFQILKDKNKGLHHVFNSNITGKRKNRYTTQKKQALNASMQLFQLTSKDNETKFRILRSLKIDIIINYPLLKCC